MVGRHASVCAILVILQERRVKRKLTYVQDVELQQLALSTLQYGVRNSADSHAVYSEILFRPWIQGQSALSLATANDMQVFLADKRVQAVVEDVWHHGPEWRDIPDHPSAIWKLSNNPGPLYISLVTDYLARWSSPR